MSRVGGHPPETRERVLKMLDDKIPQDEIRHITGVAKSTMRIWRHERDSKAPVTPPPDIPAPDPPPNSAKLLFLDIETLPNMGFFFDTYSERAIALDFIVKPKSICTIAYKFAADLEPTVLCAAEPYNDKGILEQLPAVMERADYVVWHFGEGFDRKFLEGRLFANGLPPLRPVASVDTYKIARNKFGKTLNSNKLDHLGDLLGIGRKNKTDAMLWVKCAQGNIEAMQEMARYNAQDVMLLEAVYNKLSSRGKVNHNAKHDDAVNRCGPCNSTNIEYKGHVLTGASFKHCYQCLDCKAWSTFARGKK